MIGDYLDYLIGLCREAYARRSPIYTENIFRWQVRQDIVTRRLLLPLANGDNQPAILLAELTFDAADDLLDGRCDQRHDPAHRIEAPNLRSAIR